MRNQAGAVFDLYEDQYTRFIDGWNHLQEAEAGRLDFEVCRCSDLPELAEDDPMSLGMGWRNEGDSYGNYGGGGRGNYRGNNFGGDRGGRGMRGGGPRGGGRGGGGYHDYDSRSGGRGGWRGGPSNDGWDGNDMGGGGGWRSGGGNNYQKQYSADFGYAPRGRGGYRGGYDRGDSGMEPGPSSFGTYGGDGERGGRGGRGGYGDRGGRGGGGGGGGHNFQKMHSEQIGGGSSFQQKPRGDGCTIYVGNLSINTDKDALQ